MYKRQRVKKLGRKKTHRESMINNQMVSLFKYGYIQTTSSRARVLRGETEKLLKDNTDKVLLKRKLRKIFNDKDLINKVIEYLEKQDKGVKLVKIGFRKGDMTEMTKVELIGFKKEKKKVEVEKKTTKKKKVEKKKEKKTGNIIKEISKRTPNISDKNIEDIPKKERAKSRSGL